MKRLLVHVEGETEETFVNEVLTPVLRNNGYSAVSARLMGNARQREHRGGVRSWVSARKDILRHLRGDSACLSTTMVDYYGLPQSGTREWPGRRQAGELNRGPDEKAALVERALLEDICNELSVAPGRCHFIPFVVVHEFEALLFSDCRRFAEGIGRQDLTLPLSEIRASFETPEHINDSPDSAPSKRIKILIPGYQKPLFGSLAALAIGLDKIVRECPHFRGWIDALQTHV